MDPEITFDDLTDLGVFASRFQIPALSNQISDRIRANVASDEWKLQPSIVERFYGAAPSGSPLRETIRAALGKLPKSTMEAGANREEWRNSVVKHPELGLDFFATSATPWTAESYLAGVCRFHDHDDVHEQKSPGALCDGCPYEGEDCYPASVVSNGSQFATAESAMAVDMDAVKTVVSRPEDGFVDDTSPAIRQRVGNGIMITADEGQQLKSNGLHSISEATDEVNGGRPRLQMNGSIESDDAIEDPNETVTSEDQADEVSHARTIGTMTDVLNGETDTTGDKADDEAVKVVRTKSKNSKKKNKGRASFSVGTN